MDAYIHTMAFLLPAIPEVVALGPEIAGGILEGGEAAIGGIESLFGGAEATTSSAEVLSSTATDITSQSVRVLPLTEAGAAPTATWDATAPVVAMRRRQ